MQLSLRKPCGFTLAELLVAASIMTIIGLVLVHIFNVAKTTHSQQGGRIAMHHLARETLDRIHPLLVSANGTTPVVHPPAGTANRDDTLVFTSTADFIYDTGFDPTNITSHQYRIRLYDNDVLMELYDGDVVTNTETLARSTADCTIENLLFARPDGTLSTVRARIYVEAEVRSAVNQVRRVQYELETATHIPYYTTQTE